MQFAGEHLEAILRRQTMPVEVVDFSGRVCLSAPGPEVIGRFALTGYVGVGNNSRIRFVKPEGVRYRQEEFGSKRQIKTHFDACAELVRHAQMNPVAKTAKKWVAQPANAKTGRRGSATTIRFRN
jgi:hypothetical protein